MLPLVTILVLYLQAQLGSGDTDVSQIALKFGADANSYVSYNPDMRAFTNAFTLCSWIRQFKGAGDYPNWFAYPSGSTTMYLIDSGYYCLFDSYLDLRSKLSSTITPGEWYHVCLSWSSQGNTGSVYWNGVLAGEVTAPSGSTVPAGGTLILGNYKPGDSWYFGGEMSGLNMYNRVLTAEEIRDIAELGYCPGTEELFDDSRVLKWEDILQQTRTGDVKEVEIADMEFSDACKLKKATEELEKSKQTLTSTTQQLNTSTEELEKTKQTLTSTTQQLNTSTEELEKTKQTLTSTTQQLNTANDELDVVTQQLDDMAQCLENKIELKFAKNRQAKRVIAQFKTCRTTEEREEEE